MATGQKISAMTAATAFASGDIIPIVSSGANEGLDHDVLMKDPQIIQAWFNLDGTGTISERDNYNIASYDDNGTGDYTAYFDNDMDNTNYCFLNGSGDTSGDTNIGSLSPKTITTSSFRFTLVSATGGVVDRDYVCVAFLGGRS